jgi:hypothetical protein
VWEYGGRNRKAAKPRCFKNLKIYQRFGETMKSLDDCSYKGRVVNCLMQK